MWITIFAGVYQRDRIFISILNANQLSVRVEIFSFPILICKTILCRFTAIAEMYARLSQFQICERIVLERKLWIARIKLRIDLIHFARR